MLLVPAPGIVRDRPGLPDRACRLLQLTGRNPACRFDHFGRISFAKLGIAIEHRAAADCTVDSCNLVFASQGKMLARCLVAARARIIANDAVGQRIPGNELSRAAGGSQMLCFQQPVGIGAHQERSVAPRPDELLVVPPSLDHHVGQTKRERASVPGRTRSQTSALLASPTFRGSITISFIPRFRPATVAVAWVMRENEGL